MAAEEDSEECTCKLLSTITQTTSSGGAKVPDGVPVPPDLMFDCEQLQTPLLDTTTALIERRSCGMVWVAWTEFGSVGEGRRTSLRLIDKFSQIPTHPGLEPVGERTRAPQAHCDLCVYLARDSAKVETAMCKLPPHPHID